MYLSSFLYIVQAHSHSIFNVAVTLTLTPVLQKLKKQYFFPKDLRLPQLDVTFTKFSLS